MSGLTEDQKSRLLERFRSLSLGSAHLSAAHARMLVAEVDAVLGGVVEPEPRVEPVVPDGVVTIACDGSCLANPDGPTGWAWVATDGRSDSGGLANGTNNIGELLALINALEAHPDTALHLQLDSQYVLNSATKWIPGWKRKGWKTASGKPVANVDLMRRLDELLRAREEAGIPTTWEWVRGHNQHALNEEADRLAGEAARLAR